LLAFAPPVEEVGAGQDELVAVVAVQIPGAGAVDDMQKRFEIRVVPEVPLPW
jgi:hypothetical protein